MFGHHHFLSQYIYEVSKAPSNIDYFDSFPREPLIYAQSTKSLVVIEYYLMYNKNDRNVCLLGIWKPNKEQLQSTLIQESVNLIYILDLLNVRGTTEGLTEHKCSHLSHFKGKAKSLM